MYSETNRRASVRRANDEFLRRMLGGELTSTDLPVMNAERPTLPVYPEVGRPACDGTVSDSKLKELENNAEHHRPHANQSHGRPICDDAVSSGKPQGDCGTGDCPTCIDAPSLAMVYAPKQCWRNLLEPQSALQAGSLFAELILPLEVGGYHTREGRGK